MNDDKTGLIIQLLRGLDNGMPQAMQPMWQKMTPEFQKQKMHEQMMQQQQEQMLRQGGGAEVAPEMAEYDQYRRSRQ